MLIFTLLYTSSPAQAGDRLDTVVRPVAQRIDLSIDPAKTTFDGTTTITFEVPRRAKVASVPLHGEGLTIRQATLARTSGWRGERTFEVTVATEEPDRLTVTPESPLRAGTYAITFDYEGQLHEQGYGLYRFEHDGEPYVVSQMEADEARTAWPCFDEPSYKIPWTIAVEHPPDTVAISNAPIVRTRPAGDNRIEQFDTTPPMPSYAVAIAVGPYVATPIAGMKVPSKVWTTRGQERLAASAARDLPAIVEHLEGWFGEPYPYKKLDLIAAPKFAFGAMENPGAIVYTESLFFGEETATPSREHRLIEVSA
ncbi:MAG: M1 family aminopeptidase, partial [Myxococcota bacterium]